MELIVVLALVAVAFVIVAAPLRAGRAEAEEEAESAERSELEATREAKYREIREAELDYRTGKLDEAEWRMQDRRLRGEAIELLRALDQLS